jgi:hypothetical protein
VAPQRPGDHDVEDQGVDASVPGDVNEPSQLRPVAGADPARTRAVHLGLPVMVTGSMAEAFGVQSLDLGAGKGPAPLAVDHMPLYASPGPGGI